jgi:hypothetical protein
VSNVGSSRRFAGIDFAWAALPVLLPAIVALGSRMRAIDLAYHVRLGEQILSLHAIPRVDTFTFSVPGRGWTDQQWLAQVMLDLLYRAGGWSTVSVARAALTSLTFLLVFLACRASGTSVRTSSLLALAAFLAGAPILAMRPQLFVVPLFALALWALAGRDEHPRRLWLLPPAALLAANVHGSFPLFVVLGALAWITDRKERPDLGRRELIVTAATVLATLVNPFGVGVWGYAVAISANPTIRDTVTEWAPLSVRDPAGALTFASALAIAVYLARRGRATRWSSLLWLGAFLVPAFVSQRSILWWCLVAPVVVAGELSQHSDAERPRPASSPPAPAYMVVATLIVVLVAFLPWWRRPEAGQLLEDAPQGLTSAVERLPAGSRLFVSQPWASWFEFATPSDPVFVDSRIELFPQGVWTEYGQVGFAGARWHEVLDRWKPDAIVADASSWDLIPILRDDPGWRVAYEDGDGVLFVRA